MSYKLHDQIFDEFCKMCPWAAPKVSKWYETGTLEIIIELKDGSAMHYDYILKAFRYEPSLDELLEKLKVHDEEEWRMEFARRLYKKMCMKGYTQEELSWRTGISQGTLAKYVNGLITPGCWNIRKIATELKCTIADLVDF